MENTKIEWAHHTFNPWIGCTKVSPACDFCYAEGLATARLGVAWGPDAPRRRTAASTWKLPLRWNRQAARLGVRYRVFCASLADILDNHKSIDPQWRLDLARMIEATPYLDWLLLTKRIGNASKMLREMFPNGVPDNVWLGITVCNQQEADRDIPKLRAVKAKHDIRRAFLSIEPLLGPIMLDGTSIDWIIVGGETGRGSRPMLPDWAMNLRDQCAQADIPFLFKQHGDWAPGESIADHHVMRHPETGAYWTGEGWHFEEFTVRAAEELHTDDEPTVWRVGKRNTSRYLDGVEHNGVPA